MLFFKANNNASDITGGFHCSLARTRVFKHDAQKNFTGEYEGFTNLKGQIAVNDSSYKRVYDFSCNRAFVRKTDETYMIIDTQGKVVAQHAFDQIMNEPRFYDGLAFVSVKDKWGVIDTNANFVIPPTFDVIYTLGMVEDYFFFGKEKVDKNGYTHYSTGICRKDGHILLDAVIQNLDREGFKSGLLKCTIGNKDTYINREGKIVWQESQQASKALRPVNIDYQQYSYFCAQSTENEPFTCYGMRSFPQCIADSFGFPPAALSVIVMPEKPDSLAPEHRVRPVFIANTLHREITFNQIWMQLIAYVQALDENKEWQDIEYLPSLECNGGDYAITLEPGYYWKFAMPVYEGDYKTQLRIVLKYIDPNEAPKKIRHREKKEMTVYSNTFEGSVNPGQFWRKENWRPPAGLVEAPDK